MIDGSGAGQRAEGSGWMVKQRARRVESPLPAATVIVRGDLLDPAVLAESAQRNFEVYGFCGVSVFSETAKVPWTDLAAARFPAVPWLVLFSAGDLTAAGLAVGHGRRAALRRDLRRSRRARGSYAGDDTPGGAEPASHARGVTDADD